MRRCLREPIAELELASKLLDATVDAHILGNTELASLLLKQSDLPEVSSYAISLVGKMSQEIHRNIKRPKCLPKEERDPARMPSEKIQLEIFARDGWRCRFCNTKVINRKARGVLVKAYQDETNWSAPEFERHSALYAMAASLDHVVPHGRGGKNEMSNFVTACYCCQFGRGEWTLDEVEILDPRERKPINDQWDGLTRLLAT